MTLCEFCFEHGLDVSNISKMERGRMAPPQKREILERYADYLGVEKGSDDWYEFFDLAAAEAGRIPHDILTDEELLRKVPIFFRVARGQDVSEDDVRRLLDSIGRA